MNRYRDNWLTGVTADTQLDVYAHTVAHTIAHKVTGLSPVSYANTRHLNKTTGYNRQTILDAVEDLKETGWLAEHPATIYATGSGGSHALTHPAEQQEDTAA
ncbi:hypothetical protein [Arthrobacter roseus]|uniref:hypothetical protein n=1 Tax=Arthrobacter roseus TaxID=136274 RepID=UPI0019641E1E|nr:hypothetical protein [Arthrobacter roseus]MBM7848808.1 hypothetical protein [Arthrobacter roseus]